MARCQALPLRHPPYLGCTTQCFYVQVHMQRLVTQPEDTGGRSVMARSQAQPLVAMAPTYLDRTVELAAPSGLWLYSCAGSAHPAWLQPTPSGHG